MANKSPNAVMTAFEKIVANPLYATITVGISILFLQAVIYQLSHFWPAVDYLKYIIPFVPPYFITCTAKRLNEQRAEYDFIQDAAPYIFVALPKEPTVVSVLESQTCIISNSAQRHLNRPIPILLNQTPLAPEYLADPSKRLAMAQALVDAFRQNGRLGVLENYPIELRPHGAENPVLYLMASVLKQSNGRTKWQATLTRYVPCSNIATRRYEPGYFSESEGKN